MDLLIIEPDLSAPIQAGYQTTWGDKKAYCKIEARYAYERGETLADNPYIENTWPHKWWSEFFSQCSGPRNKPVVSIIN